MPKPGPPSTPAEIASLSLGAPTTYPDRYDPALLRPVPRRLNRGQLGLAPDRLPFHGRDDWTAYEVSWLEPGGKPRVAIGRFAFPCTSPNLVESKSLKLYLNGFNQARFGSSDTVAGQIASDLGACAGAPVAVDLLAPERWGEEEIVALPGESIDELPIAVDRYSLDPKLLDGAAPGPLVEETLHSHLLKSNCLVTSQPDWGSVLVRYRGPRIEREALLRYLISYRQHSEFHEQCVERIFTDLMHCCAPTQLTVHARYTRRGGLDISPFRSNFEAPPALGRLARQ
jgi:7-cyano-7-deazaguanine reductase